MWRLALTLCASIAWSGLEGAEMSLDFSQFAQGDPPAGFRALLTGSGAPGHWQIVMGEVPSAMPSLTPGVAAMNKVPVLAQTSQDPTDERFPVLVYDVQTFGDFAAKMRFRTVAGAKEQMAGLAFRIQDERNYYVVRASSLGGTFYFYKFVDGLRSPPIGPKLELAPGTWHELGVECKGNTVRVTLDGRETMPTLTDNSFAQGKLGFWTKSDSVSHFADLRVTYTPIEPLARALVRQMQAKYPRLLGLDLYSTTSRRAELHVVASADPAALGRPGGKVERDVVAREKIYYGKSRKKALVTMPLRDRNGDPVGAVRFTMEAFFGQTEQNALGRAMPILHDLQNQITTLKELTE